MKRYEEALDGGTYCLYNASDDSLWCGNYSSKLLTDLIDGKASISDIKQRFASVIDSCDDTLVNDTVDGILLELLDKKILEKV